MGNPMTPFVPPAAAFDPPVVNLLASTSVAGVFTLTSRQALSDIFYISGTATVNDTGPYLAFPTNSPAKAYTIVASAITFGTTLGVMGLQHIGGGGVQAFYASLTMQFVHFPSGSPVGSYFARTSATNIAYNAG